MQTVMIKYQPFGIGEWTTLYVSTDLANALEKEYMRKICRSMRSNG